MRKQGKKIKNKLALKPLGFKSNKYELNARTALLKAEHGIYTQQNMIGLYCLQEIVRKLSGERYVQAHADSVKRLSVQAAEDGHISRMDYISLEASSDILLQVFAQAKNADIARVSLEAAGRFAA